MADGFDGFQIPICLHDSWRDCPLGESEQSEGKKRNGFWSRQKKPPTTNSVPQKLFLTNKNKFVKEIVDGGGGFDELWGVSAHTIPWR